MSNKLPLTERLRNTTKCPTLYPYDAPELCCEAADEIDRGNLTINLLTQRLAAAEALIEAQAAELSRLRVRCGEQIDGDYTEQSRTAGEGCDG